MPAQRDGTPASLATRLAQPLGVAGFQAAICAGAATLVAHSNSWIADRGAGTPSSRSSDVFSRGFSCPAAGRGGAGRGAGQPDGAAAGTASRGAERGIRSSCWQLAPSRPHRQLSGGPVPLSAFAMPATAPQWPLHTSSCTRRWLARGGGGASSALLGAPQAPAPTSAPYVPASAWLGVPLLDVHLAPLDCA